MKYLLLFVLINFNIQNKSNKDLLLLELYKNIKIEKDCRELFFNRIMNDEKFSDTIYFDIAGHKIIGYGHLIRSNEYFTKITKNDALKLLEKDFFEYSNEVKNLSIKQKFAALHFIFCLGIGTYKTIQKDFKKNVLKYCYYKSNNKYIFSKMAYNMRKFEYDNY